MVFIALFLLLSTLIRIEAYLNPVPCGSSLRQGVLPGSCAKTVKWRLPSGNNDLISLKGSEDKELPTIANPYEVFSTVGQGGFLPVFMMKNLFAKTLTKGTIFDASLLFGFFGVMDVLASALDRNRLDGTTFKYLNLGVFLSSIVYFLRSLKSFYGMGVWDIVKFIFILSSGMTAALKLKTHGLPNVTKLTLKGEKGYCPFSSTLFLISGITSLAASLRHLMSGITAFGSPIGSIQASISCLIPFISLVESQAVLSRRLQSQTYRDLNWILLLTSAISILTSPAQSFSLHDSIQIDKFLWMVSTLSSVVAAALGLQIGYSLNK